MLTPEKATSQMPENSNAKLSPADDDNEDAAFSELSRKRKKLRSAFGDFGDKVRISEIMEAPNIAQEENKKLRATLEDLTRRPNIVEEEDKKLREAASSAASAMAGSQHDAFQDVGAPSTPAHSSRKCAPSTGEMHKHRTGEKHRRTHMINKRRRSVKKTLRCSYKSLGGEHDRAQAMELVREGRPSRVLGVLMAK